MKGWVLVGELSLRNCMFIMSISVFFFIEMLLNMFLGNFFFLMEVVFWYLMKIWRMESVERKGSGVVVGKRRWWINSENSFSNRSSVNSLVFSCCRIRGSNLVCYWMGYWG